MPIEILVTVGLLAANGFFVATEFSLARLRPTQIDEWERASRPGAKSVRHAVDHIDAYLAACQLGITLASLGLGVAGEPVFEELLHPLLGDGARIAGIALAGGLAFFLITMLHVVVGELAPKSLAISRTGPTALLVAPPMRAFYYATKPVVDLFNGMGNLLLKPFGIPPAREAGHAPHSEDELHAIVGESAGGGEIEEEEGRLARRALAFDELRVREVMRARHEVVTVEAAAGRDAVLRRARETGLTRFPLVGDGALDEAERVVNVKDLLLGDPDGASPADVSRPLPRMADATILTEALREMRRARVHMAVVLDDRGTAVGIVTLEDLLEELVGPIEDEFDPDRDDDIEGDAESGFVMDGDTTLHELETRVGLKVQDAHEATIGGHVIEAAGRLPDAGETVEVDGLRAEVLDAGDGRLRRLRLTRVDA